MSPLRFALQEYLALRRSLGFRLRLTGRLLERNWYRTGVDVERYLPRLSTYLGHVHVTDTYWYLTATPELMQLARRQLERALRGLRP